MQTSSELEHSTQPQSSREPRLIFEEFLHLLPKLCQLACGPKSYDSGFLQLLSEDGVYERASFKCETKVGRPTVVPQPFLI